MLISVESLQDSLALYSHFGANFQNTQTVLTRVILYGFVRFLMFPFLKFPFLEGGGVVEHQGSISYAEDPRQQEGPSA